MSRGFQMGEKRDWSFESSDRCQERGGGGEERGDGGGEEGETGESGG